MLSLGREAADLLGVVGEELADLVTDDVAAGLDTDDVVVVDLAAPKVGLVVEAEEGEAGFAAKPEGFTDVLVSAALGDEEEDEGEVELGWLKAAGMVTEDGLVEDAAGLDGVVLEAVGLDATEVEAVEAAGLEDTEEVVEVVAAGLDEVEVAEVVVAAGLDDPYVAVFGEEVAAAGLELYKKLDT